nr:Dihydrofolate reductase [uncultured bacterium]
MLSIVVALTENNVIGTGNKLPWRMSDDLKRVKALTMGHHLIMGRKTFESIGRPLPGRTTVIITRSKDFVAEGCMVVNSLEEAIRVSENDNEAFVFGGGEIFKQALAFTHRIYLTKIHTVIDGDTFFPELDPNEWLEVSNEFFPKNEKNDFDCTVLVLERK